MGAIASEEQQREDKIMKKRIMDCCARISSSQEGNERDAQPNVPSSLLERLQKPICIRVVSPWRSAELIDNLFIGDARLAATVLSTGHHMGFTHILSLFASSILSSFCKVVTPPILTRPSPPSERPVYAHFEMANYGSRLERMVVPLSDTPEQRILHVLEPCFEFIDDGIRQGSVLVHCLAGVSRSAAIVTAYLMRTLKLPLQEALILARKKHKRASPNPGFLQQLQWFESNYLREQVSQGTST